jgi:hypothetical protein
VILDAMIVIEAHALGIWHNLLDKIDAMIPQLLFEMKLSILMQRRLENAAPFCSARRSVLERLQK